MQTELIWYELNWRMINNGFLSIQPPFGSCSPLQLVSVLWQSTLPHQADTQQCHQVSVKSSIILREVNIQKKIQYSSFSYDNVWSTGLVLSSCVLLQADRLIMGHGHQPHLAPACGCCRWRWRGFWGSLWHAERLPVRWVAFLGPAHTHTAPSTQPPGSSPGLQWGWTHLPPWKSDKVCESRKETKTRILICASQSSTMYDYH